LIWNVVHFYQHVSLVSAKTFLTPSISVIITGSNTLHTTAVYKNVRNSREYSYGNTKRWETVLKVSLASGKY